MQHKQLVTLFQKKQLLELDQIYMINYLQRKVKTPGGQTRMKRRPKYGGPGAIQAMSIPAGIAINTGLGLMTPFGGAEGYKAALPSEEDPSKTSNVLGEVAMKYIMGRTGNLLPYEDFVKVRPDVSGEEFGRYKAFKFDKSLRRRSS